jgi:hypothetical protein
MQSALGGCGCPPTLNSPKIGGYRELKRVFKTLVIVLQIMIYMPLAM